MINKLREVTTVVIIAGLTIGTALGMMALRTLNGDRVRID